MTAKYEENVENILGSDAWNLLFKNVNDYKIDKNQMDDVAKILGVGGKHQRRREEDRAKTDHTEWRRIMSDWFNQEDPKLKCPKDRPAALMRLSEAFAHQNVALHPLANDLKEMAEVKKKQMPASGPILQPLQPPDLIQSTTPATGTLPIVDSQVGDTCASHAIAKAVLAILDKAGFDAQQDKVVTSLKALFPDNSAHNPDEFHDKDITVTETNTGKEIRVKINITTKIKWIEPLNSKDNNQDFSKEPMFFTEEQYNNNCKLGLDAMVLRWDLGLSGEDPVTYAPARATHAIYAKSYNPATNVFCCINSWDKDFNPTPNIHHSRILAVDFVQLEELGSN